MDVVCVQDKDGEFHYSEFYVRFKLPALDQASLALFGTGEESSGRLADVMTTMDDAAIAAMAKKDVDQLIPPAEPSWIVIFLNGKQLEDVTAFVGMGQIMHFYDPQTRQYFITPSREYFRRFLLKPGKNKFVCWHKATDTSVVFNLWWYELSDKLMIMDIDGTITKSDLTGYIQTVYLGMFTYIHDGLVDFLSTLSKEHHLKLIYLTSRPMGHRRETINLLKGIRGKDGTMLPDGPLFTTKSRLMVALYKEVITKETAQLKSNMLQNVSRVFHEAGLTRISPFVLGIGNKENDALAYNSVGLPGENILLINTTSLITVWKHSNFSSSSSSASSSRMSTPQQRRGRGLPVNVFAGMSDSTARAMVAQRLQSAPMPPPGSPRLRPMVAEDDEGATGKGDGEPAPPPPPGGETTVEVVGEEILVFKSYNDPNLLGYVDRVVQAITLNF